MSDLDELRDATQKGDRLDESNNDSDEDLVDEIVGAITEVESGDRPKTIAVRDQPIAALLAALDEADQDEMVDVGHALEDALNRDHSDEFDRSEIARLAFRVGLQEAAPEIMDQLGEAIGKHAQQNV
ncbi:hypothetical protein [Natrinema sp. DC36]|uniref:hypothetical protein n=1 Tax=Natrinema sp. DC36 TaxID=2878680 RepID=UPI001CF04732|nr:hypothetical protein [Natrinema sp. DC36]